MSSESARGSWWWRVLLVGALLWAGVLVVIAPRWWNDHAAREAARRESMMAQTEQSARAGELQALDDSLLRIAAVRRDREADGPTPYLVISTADRRLWLRAGDQVRFEAPVATGTGDLPDGGTARFATPRGRLVVERKEDDPIWIPPDWHFEEVAAERGLRLVRLDPRRPLRVGDGVLRVVGHDVVRERADGSVQPLPPGKEIIIGRLLVIPPFGTRQRRFRDVLGPHRLYLGQGYGIHGTNVPESIGQAASHGCIRMRNADIEALAPLVPVGTPVYIY